MRIFLAKTLLAAAVATLPFTASASLLDPREYEAGQLTWLHITETAGMSVNDFAAGAGGWNTKYRLAFNHEVDQLIGSFGLQLGDTGYQSQGNGAGGFLYAVGGTGELGYAGTYYNDGNLGVKAQGLGRYVWADFTNGYHPEPLGPECDAYFSCARFLATDEADYDTRRSDTGLLLVRLAEPPVGVPEPASLGLFAVAAVMVYQRRRKQK